MLHNCRKPFGIWYLRFIVPINNVIILLRDICCSVFLFFSQFCDVMEVVIIHKKILPILAIYTKVTKFKHLDSFYIKMYSISLVVFFFFWFKFPFFQDLVNLDLFPYKNLCSQNQIFLVKKLQIFAWKNKLMCSIYL
jgi:hypothetical protein